MADWDVDISRWVTKARERVQRAPEAVGYALLARVQELTPVVTGRLRAAWQIEVELDRIVISNNIEYARRINDGFVGQDSLGRYYDQTGYHMIEQTIAEAPAIADRAIRELKR